MNITTLSQLPGNWGRRLFTNLLFLATPFMGIGQQAAEQTPADSRIAQIITEATEDSQLEQLAHQLLDVIGPRLVGSPQMEQAHNWAVDTYKSWGITARNEQFGEWQSWERGISHIDMVSPWVKSLNGTQLAWSPSTGGKPVEGTVITLPEFADSTAFKAWLPEVKGKHVLISMPQLTGRPDHNWAEYAQETSFEKLKAARAAQAEAWANRMRKIGLFEVTEYSLPGILEAAGAAGIVTSYWSREFGSNKIFDARTKTIPTVDLSLEDYGLLYRLAESGHAPRIRITTASTTGGMVPTFNTIAEIPGTEHPDEYVILSAHFDSWDGGTGATDNGTGVITMMEAARILKKIIPTPKRTILIGLWGSEEQGLNGSRAFVLDQPDIVAKTQAVFNLDNGTGRVSSINGSGFLHAYDFMGRWLNRVPADIRDQIETTFPGTPPRGGSDYASFAAAGIPAFMLSALSWGYGTITWHTNLDTYDKLVFDDLKNNVILTAILAYCASEEPELVNREQRTLPPDSDGNPGVWPAIQQPNRNGRPF